MSDYVLAGPDIGVRFVDLDTLMTELGPDEGINAAKASDKVAVVVASSDPLRLVRTAREGDTKRSFSDFLALVPPDWVPPGRGNEPPEEDDAEDEAPVPATASPSGVFASRPKVTTVGEAVRDMVEMHENGSQTFYTVQTDITITVPWEMIVIATSQADAEAKVNNFRTTGEETEGLINFDPETILATAVTAINHARTPQDAGWDFDPGEIAKLTTEEMTALARQVVHQMVDRLNAETTATARTLRDLMRQSRR